MSLLFANGAIAQLEEESILKITQIDQVDFKGSSKKTNHLTAEISRSVIVLDLQEGDLVVEVKKLHKKSLFQVNTQHFQAGIIGTMFKAVSSSSISDLAVLEGRIEVTGEWQPPKSLDDLQQLIVRVGKNPQITQLYHIERANISNRLREARSASKNFDLTFLSNLVRDFSRSQRYTVGSALDLEMIWCPPLIFTPSSINRQPIRMEGFYISTHLVTQDQIKQVVGRKIINKSEGRGGDLPVENLTWKEANEFCEILTRKEKSNSPSGWGFTLPSMELSYPELPVVLPESSDMAHWVQRTPPFIQTIRYFNQREVTGFSVPATSSFYTTMHPDLYRKPNIGIRLILKKLD